jgi:biofilm PGA synthesis N-glycosyltransferase PgaC
MTDSGHRLMTAQSEKTAANSAPAGISPRYVVIMPARDEERYIGAALESLVRQAWVASAILVVDDGSTDSTADIVQRYSQRYPFVQLLRRPNRGSRQPGPGVVDAFHHGLKSLADSSYDYVAKLDADCEYPPDYFRRVLGEFQNNPQLGICGGVPLIRTRAGLHKDKRPPHHVRGATKIYRKSCFTDIGGLEPLLGWDILDDFTARSKGWEAYTLESASYTSNRTVGAPIGLWRKWMHEGRTAYIQHHLLIYLIARSIRRCVNKPYILSGLLLILGYILGWWEKRPRVKDQNIIHFLRQEQREYLWRQVSPKIK